MHAYIREAGLDKYRYYSDYIHTNVFLEDLYHAEMFLRWKCFSHGLYSINQI